MSGSSDNLVLVLTAKADRDWETDELYMNDDPIFMFTSRPKALTLEGITKHLLTKKANIVWKAFVTDFLVAGREEVRAIQCEQSFTIEMKNNLVAYGLFQKWLWLTLMYQTKSTFPLEGTTPIYEQMQFPLIIASPTGSGKYSIVNYIESHAYWAKFAIFSRYTTPADRDWETWI